MVTPTVDDDVRMNVPRDRVNDSDAISCVLQHPRLLDVHLDPPREVVEHVNRVTPAFRRISSLDGVLPETTPIVESTKMLAKILVGDTLER